MNVAVVIPWRAGDPWRERLFDWVLPAWQATGWRVCVGVDDPGGPFNCARALNRARNQAGGWVDVLVVASADHVPNPDAVATAVQWCASHPWAPIYGHTTGVSKRGTDLLLAGQIDVDGLEPYRTDTVPFCTALLAVRSSTWDSMGGWDERFHGWGCEDTAYRAAIACLYPNPPTPTATTYALWHPAAPRDRFDANCELLGEYLAAEHDPYAMRQVLLRWRS